MRFNKRFIRAVSWTLVASQVSLLLQPASVLAADKGASSPMVQAHMQHIRALLRDIEQAQADKVRAQQTPADFASERLTRVEELVRGLRRLSADQPQPMDRDRLVAIGPDIRMTVHKPTEEQRAKWAAERSKQRGVRLEELRKLLDQQAADQQAMRDEFAQSRKMLIERKLPAVILQRHDEAVSRFDAQTKRFNEAALAARSGDAQALAALEQYFEQAPTSHRAAPLDPKNLPWRSPEPTRRQPATTQTAWFQNLWHDRGARLAQAGPVNIGELNFLTAPEPSQAPVPDDLADTPETARTAAIVSKAAELNNNPVQIHNWVRNNVEWLPTWGAAQTADDTLSKKRGNALDIASLEIALLRAAKVPARYQLGTIDVPAEQLLNWAGKPSRTETALELLGQGGVANTGLAQGGQIKTVRMEHAWVRAYVNWVPARGAKPGSSSQHPNPAPQRNAWVPLDASFKQYSYEPAQDLTSPVPFDAPALAASAVQGATVNETEGWVQNVQSNAIDDGIEAYAHDLAEYARTRAATNDPGAALGRKIIPAVVRSLLDNTLPYGVVTQATDVARLPDSLVHRVTIRLYASQFDLAAGSPTVQYSLPLHQASKRLTATYSAATAADQATIDAAKASGAKSLPLYLIRMKGQLQLEGQKLVDLPTATMGSEQYWTAAFDGPSGASSGELDFKYVSSVGDAVVFGFNASGVDGASIERRRAAVTAASADETLYLTALNYWALTDTMHQTLGAHLKVGVARLPSVGLFLQPLHVQYRFGVPWQGYYAGRAMDVRRSLSAVAAPDATQQINFMRKIGMVDSYLEGATFDALFSHGLGSSGSAVSTLAEANRQGLKIFKVTASNYATVAPQLAGLPSGDLQTVEDAINAGQEVLIPERAIQHGSWYGVGKIIVDPTTGAGAYLLSGGDNGGTEDTCVSERQTEPEPVRVPSLGLIGTLFFVLIMVALAAWVIGPAVAYAVGLLLTTMAASAQAMSFVPVAPLDQFGYAAWSSTFGKVYGPWPSSAPDAVARTCTPATEALLAAAKGAACGRPRSCNLKEPCPDYEFKIQNGLNCAQARIAVMSTCYPVGPGAFGDAAHVNELGNVMNVLGKCMCYAAGSGCPVVLNTP